EFILVLVDRMPDDFYYDVIDHLRFLAQIVLDRLEIGIRGHQADAMAFLPIAFDRDVVLETRDDDLSVPDVRRAVHGHEIAVQNTGVPHAHALYPAQKMRLRLEQIGIDLIARLDMLLGKNRRARRDAADERQAELLAQRILQTNAARRAGQQLDRTFALERAQMLLGRIDRPELQPLSNLCPGRRHTGAVNRLLDQIQNLSLTRSEIAHRTEPRSGTV